MTPYKAFEPWLIPVAFLSGGFVIGIVAERIALPLIQKATAKIHFESAAIVAHSMRKMVFLWILLAGLRGALTTAPVKPETVVFFGQVVMVLFLVSLTVVLARISADLFDAHAKKRSGDTPTVSLFTVIIRLFVFGMGTMVVFQSLGISITPVLTALGVGGIAVALALQDTLSNLFAGMQILAARQIKSGDFVHLETGEEGYVTDVTWRNTVIRAINNTMIIVPNSKLASTILNNYHQPIREMLVYVYVGVHYKSDLEHVEGVTLSVAKEVQAAVEGAKKDHEPNLRYREFGGSAIQFRVALAVEEFYSSYQITHEFIKLLHQRYNEEGIVIPFHMRTLHIPDSPQITVQLHSEKQDE